MTQANPNVILYSQAIVLLQQIQQLTLDGSIQSLNDISTQLANALTQYEAGAGQPITKFDKFVIGEPPIASKINTMWTSIEYDFDIIGNQLDILRASSLITYNNITTELQQLTNLVGEASNQLGTLALFTNAVDSKTFTFGDQFASGGFIDSTQVTNDYLAQIDSGSLTLATQTAVNNLASANPKVTILPQSNGFPGNNQEINDPTASTNNSTTGQVQYSFVAQATNPNNPISIVSSTANSIFEFENYLVTPTDRTTANNFNFTYSVTSADKEFINSAKNGEIDWAAGVSNYLDLWLEIDLGSVQQFNYISYSPYGLPGDVNYPVLIKSVSTSPDGTTWTPVVATPVWVGTIANQQAASVNANVSIGPVSWTVPQQEAEFILLEIQQPNPIPCNIGHLYYTDSTSGIRVEGPVPSIDDTSYYYTNGQSVVGSMNQVTEYFVGQRWAIGINDISVQQNEYQATSTMVTRRIEVGGTVSEVALEADVTIPADFDSTQSWATFWVSPDDGVTWDQIGPIQDNVLNIPSVIAFNNPLPAAFQDPGVYYVTTANPVTFLRFKIELSRPAASVAETPVVKDYQLRVRLV